MQERSAARKQRRGWSPQEPWTDSEAWSRAKRYWVAPPTTVELWQQLIEQRGGYLALLVPDPRDGRSVIRYVWKLGPSAVWEDYDGRKFGFPTGELMSDHPWLDKDPSMEPVEAPSAAPCSGCDAVEVARLNHWLDRA